MWLGWYQLPCHRWSSRARVKCCLRTQGRSFPVGVEIRVDEPQHAATTTRRSKQQQNIATTAPPCFAYFRCPERPPHRERTKCSNNSPPAGVDVAWSWCDAIRACESERFPITPGRTRRRQSCRGCRTEIRSRNDWHVQQMGFNARARQSRAFAAQLSPERAARLAPWEREGNRYDIILAAHQAHWIVSAGWVGDLFLCQCAKASFEEEEEDSEAANRGTGSSGVIMWCILQDKGGPISGKQLGVLGTFCSCFRDPYLVTCS